MTAIANCDSGSSVPPPSPGLFKSIVQASGSASSQYSFVDYRAAVSPDRHRHIPPLVKQIISGLTTLSELPGGSTAKYRTLPTVLLYDNAGLELFNQITYLPEYYVTSCEIDVLRTNIQSIVAEIPDDSDVIELGCGSLRKTQILLDVLDQQRTGITYYAIDVMPLPLHESMESLAPKFANISFVALCGTYDEVLMHFKKSTRRKTVLWLGSSMGNFACSDAVELLSGIAESALVADDGIIIGMDKQKTPSVIMAAYHDAQGITAKFELNALSHANKVVSSYATERSGNMSADMYCSTCLFDTSMFCYTGEYDEKVGRHNAYLEACEDTLVRWPRELADQVKELCGDAGDLLLKRGERIYIESSYKYGEGAAGVLARDTGLTHAYQWTDARNYYHLNLFRKPRLTMSPPPPFQSSSFDKWSEPIQHARKLLQQPLDLSAPEQYPTIPALSEWRHLWSAWDTLLLHIIPRNRLYDQPIDLRHPFVFYLGHLPAFSDIHLAAAEAAPLTEPQIYAQWFERGIDPNIEDPAVCHSHSQVPDEWPLVEDILAYRDRVRSRVTGWLDAYMAGRQVLVDAARHVWMAFEHEALHIETLLYMVLQMEPLDIRPPISVTFAPLDGRKPCHSWVNYSGGSDRVFGLAGDDELALQGQQLRAGHVFGWDNERPQNRISVRPFSICSVPVTNAEYLAFLRAVSSSVSWEALDKLVPRSWVCLGAGAPMALASDYGVRTVVGTPSIVATEAALWPACVSQAQAGAYAKWAGKRLPTEPEWIHATRVYHFARALAARTPSSSYNASKCLDAHLDEMLAAQNSGALSAQEYFQQPYDLLVPSDANIDLAHWHPTPVLSGAGSMEGGGDGGIPEATFVGSAWEWTSTQFHPYAGFEPSPMYPGYSADFFDPAEAYDLESTHYVVKGGSYATHRRLAHRQTFRNWFQKGYPYVLASFRLVDEQ